MKTKVYVVFKMEWGKDDTHVFDKVFASKEDAERYCDRKEKAALIKGQQYYDNSEWYVEAVELN